MKKKKFDTLFCLFFFANAIFFPKCYAQIDSAREIEYAKRTYKLLIPTQTQLQVHSVKKPEIDTFLILKIKGISSDEFEKIEKDDIYVMVEERRWTPSITQIRRDKLTEKTLYIILGIVVPKDVLEFTLYLGDHTPEIFKAEEKIHDELEIESLDLTYSSQTNLNK
jgi:hypothetical protein